MEKQVFENQMKYTYTYIEEEIEKFEICPWPYGNNVKAYTQSL